MMKRTEKRPSPIISQSLGNILDYVIEPIRLRCPGGLVPCIFAFAPCQMLSKLLVSLPKTKHVKGARLAIANP